jgi:colicin import membrane protein
MTARPKYWAGSFGLHLLLALVLIFEVRCSKSATENPPLQGYIITSIQKEGKLAPSNIIKPSPPVDQAPPKANPPPLPEKAQPQLTPTVKEQQERARQKQADEEKQRQAKEQQKEEEKEQQAEKAESAKKAQELAALNAERQVEQQIQAEQKKKKEAEQKAAADALAKEKQEEAARKKAEAQEAARQAEMQRQMKAEEAKIQAQHDAARKAKEEAIAAEDAQRAADMASAMGAEQGARVKGEQADWGALIEAAIERNWKRPIGSPPDFKCKLHIEVEMNGRVDARRITSSCGNDQLNDSVLRAVDESNPLPPPPEPAAYDRNLTVTFIPPDR